MSMKNLKLQKLNLRFFDDSPGVTEGAGGQVADTQHAVGSPQQTQSDPIIVYGKEDATTNVETGSTQNNPNKGSDTQNQNLLTLDFEKLTTPEARKAAFTTIKDKFKDEFSQDFQGAFNQRFKDHKSLQAKVDQFEPVIQALMSYHNVKDVDSLFKIVDDDVMSELAEKEGFPSAEKYKEHLNIVRENEKYKTRETTQQQDVAAKALETSWRTQEAELKKSYTDFSLDAEFQNNPKFLEKIQAGNSVEDAYFLTHRDEILNKTKTETAKQTETNVVHNIQSKQQRIPENGTRFNPGVVRKTDPKDFTDSDLERIAEQVSKGVKIKF